MFKYLKAAVGLTSRYPGMILTIYLINLLPGIAVAGLFYNIAVAEGNGSLVLDKLLIDFDYMVFTDFMRLYGSAFSPVLFAAFGIIGIYFILSNLLTGGIFYHFKAQPQKFRLKVFIGEGWRMFGKYLLILIIELFLFFLIFLFSGLFFFVFALIAEGGSEREYILWLAVPIAFSIFMSSILMVISDYAKYITFEHQQLSTWGGFGKAVGYVFKNFRTVGFYWVIIGAGVLLGLAYLGIDVLIGMNSLFTVVLMLIIQQAVVIGRVFLKNLNYATINRFYTTHSVTRPLPVDDLEAADLMVDYDENKPSDEE
jgi:hypothetical protein